MFEKSKALFRNHNHFIGDDRDDLDTTYPFYIKKGKDAYVWDVDGNQFIDFTGSNGAITIGHANEEVNKAVINQITNFGNIFITQFTELKVEAAKKLLSLFPEMERVVFFKTGSDTTSGAIRLARVKTEKEIILTAGYHGWQDWQLNMFPDFRFKDNLHINFRFNLELLHKYLQQYKGNVAAVIVTPDINYFDADYFHELEAIIRRHNVIFILDEVASGFRYCLGGLAKKLKLTPDMICLGKGLANGFSISAVVGKNEIMKEACLKTHLWSTYNSELSGYAALIASHDVMLRENYPASLMDRQMCFVNGFRKLFKDYGLVGDIFTLPNIFHIIFADDELLGTFVIECAKQGVLLSKDYENMISLAHTPLLINDALKVIENVLMGLKQNGQIDTKENIPKNFRQAVEHRILEEFDGDINYTIYKDFMKNT